MKRAARRALLLVVLLGMALLFTGCGALLGTESDEDLQEDPLTAEPLDGLLGGRSEIVEIIVLLTVLTIAPSLLILMTCFTRFAIVLSMIRNAIGLAQMPPNQVIVGLALILTFFVMTPVLEEVQEVAITPYVENEISQSEAIDRAIVPIRTFMLRQTTNENMDTFITMANRNKSGADLIQSHEDAPTSAVIGAFITSEITRAFKIGFFIYLPFIVVDMIVASVLMSMGMMMLPPVSISLPFKVLLFVMIDGWGLTIKTLISSVA